MLILFHAFLSLEVYVYDQRFGVKKRTKTILCTLYKYWIQCCDTILKSTVFTEYKKMMYRRGLNVILKYVNCIWKLSGKRSKTFLNLQSEEWKTSNDKLTLIHKCRENFVVIGHVRSLICYES